MINSGSILLFKNSCTFASAELWRFSSICGVIVGRVLKSTFWNFSFKFPKRDWITSVNSSERESKLNTSGREILSFSIIIFCVSNIFTILSNDSGLFVLNTSSRSYKLDWISNCLFSSSASCIRISFILSFSSSNSGVCELAKWRFWYSANSDLYFSVFSSLVRPLIYWAISLFFVILSNSFRRSARWNDENLSSMSKVSWIWKYDKK